MNKDCVDSMHEWREAHAARQALHAEQVDAAIKFGLRRFEHAFASKKLAASLLDIYLGADPVSPGAKAAIARGLAGAVH